MANFTTTSSKPNVLDILKKDVADKAASKEKPLEEKPSEEVKKDAVQQAASTPEIYIAKEDFTISYNGSLLSFKVGDLITSLYMIEYLLKEKTPIELASKAGDPICCPHCQKFFFTK